MGNEDPESLPDFFSTYHKAVHDAISRGIAEITKLGDPRRIYELQNRALWEAYRKQNPPAPAMLSDRRTEGELAGLIESEHTAALAADQNQPTPEPAANPGDADEQEPPPYDLDNGEFILRRHLPKSFSRKEKDAIRKDGICGICQKRLYTSPDRTWFVDARRRKCRIVPPLDRKSDYEVAIWIPTMPKNEQERIQAARSEVPSDPKHSRGKKTSHRN